MYNIEDIYNDIKKNNLSLLKIHKKYGGASLYIPKLVHNYKEMIIAEYNGHNIYILANKYNVCENTINVILRENRKTKQQTKMKFD